MPTSKFGATSILRARAVCKPTKMGLTPETPHHITVAYNAIPEETEMTYDSLVMSLVTAGRPEIGMLSSLNAETRNWIASKATDLSDACVRIRRAYGVAVGRDFS
jgi:hypothetical protein